MMQRKEIPFAELNLNPIKFWDDSMLLTAGECEPGKFNTMTIAWGCLGVIWEKPLVLVAVRPSRYTFGFMEKYDSFTVCAFDKARYQSVLNLIGTKSGRDTDKIAASKLTVIPSSKIPAPCFDEASLIIECRKIYHSDLNPAVIDATVRSFYQRGDYHRFYLGEIVAIHGESSYQKD